MRSWVSSATATSFPTFVPRCSALDAAGVQSPPVDCAPPPVLVYRCTLCYIHKHGSALFCFSRPPTVRPAPAGLEQAAKRAFVLGVGGARRPGGGGGGGGGGVGGFLGPEATRLAAVLTHF
jgi:hypothetical protein